MAANITVSYPVCGQEFGLRFDPGPEDAAPGLARAQLCGECPDHDGKKWGVLGPDQVNVSGRCQRLHRRDATRLSYAQTSESPASAAAACSSQSRRLSMAPGAGLRTRFCVAFSGQPR